MPEKNEEGARDSEKGATMVGEPIELKHPFTVHGETFSEVGFKRRPKAKDTIEAHTLGSSEAERELILVARILGMKAEDLREMDLVDYNTVLQRFQKDFLS